MEIYTAKGASLMDLQLQNMAEMHAGYAIGETVKHVQTGQMAKVCAVGEFELAVIYEGDGYVYPFMYKFREFTSCL